DQAHVLTEGSAVAEAGAGGATLDGAALVLAQATPHAVVLASLECPGQALLSHLAALADLFRILDLLECGACVAYGEEEFGIFRKAGSLVAPIHLCGTPSTEVGPPTGGCERTELTPGNQDK